MFQTIWACNLCKKKQEFLVKTGQWYHGGMAKPVALDVDTGSDTSSIKAETPTIDRKDRFSEKATDSGHSSEKENRPEKPQISRTGSLQGKELKRQYSMTEVGHGKNRERSEDRVSGAGRASDRSRTGDRDSSRTRGEYPESTQRPDVRDGASLSRRSGRGEHNREREERQTPGGAESHHPRDHSEHKQAEDRRFSDRDRISPREERKDFATERAAQGQEKHFRDASRDRSNRDEPRRRDMSR